MTRGSSVGSGSPAGAMATGQMLPASRRSAVLPAISLSLGACRPEPMTIIEAPVCSARSCRPCEADEEATIR
jgi:hypothetical protein